MDLPLIVEPLENVILDGRHDEGIAVEAQIIVVALDGGVSEKSLGPEAAHVAIPRRITPYLAARTLARLQNLTLIKPR